VVQTGIANAQKIVVTVRRSFLKINQRSSKKINKCISDGLMHVAAWHRRTPESKFTKFGKEMSIGQTPNHAKFCGDPTRSVRDIHDQISVIPKKLDQNSPKSVQTCYPLKPPIMPNFTEIVETT